MTDALAWGVDAAGELSVALLRAQGASFVCCYLAPGGSKSWKVRSPATIKAYTDAGIRVVFNWEADGLPVGRQGGADAAKAAQTQLNERGWPDAPVIFTFADRDGLDPAKVAESIAGAVSVMGFDRVGAYGNFDVIKYLADRNVCRYFWQTYAWSKGRWDPRAQLRQWKNTDTIDFDTAWAIDFGQVPRPAAEQVPTGGAPAGGDSSSSSNAPTVYGEIGKAYAALGGEAFFGAPTRPEGPAADGGRWQSFAKGRLYWHPSRTGGAAHAIYGAIGGLYDTYQAGKTAENGWLGFPVGEEYGVTAGEATGRVQDFEHGSIFYSVPTGAAAVGIRLATYWKDALHAGQPFAWPASSERAEPMGVVSLADSAQLFWQNSTSTPFHAQ